MRILIALLCLGFAGLLLYMSFIEIPLKTTQHTPDTVYAVDGTIIAVRNASNVQYLTVSYPCTMQATLFSPITVVLDTPVRLRGQQDWYQGKEQFIVHSLTYQEE
ncbi:MAG: hypothetical protein ACMXYC_04710 [Candidatus Woesearchaeota archaeon]